MERVSHLRYLRHALEIAIHPSTLFIRIGFALRGLSRSVRKLSADDEHPSMSLRSALKLVLFPLVLITIQPILIFLWFLDILIWGYYMDTPVHAPVFIYAPPCTGSTTLHGVLAANKDHFCAVEMHELLLPFIATAKMHDWIRVGQAKMKQDVSRSASQEDKYSSDVSMTRRVLKTVLGIDLTEVMARCPMGNEAEGDDVLFMLYRCVGEMAFLWQPLRAGWLWGACLAHSFTPDALAELVQFQKHAVVQKVMFRRGGTRTYVSKSRMIDLAPYHMKAFPGARFVALVREAAPAFCSYWSLHTCISRDVASVHTDTHEFLHARLAFLEHYFQQMFKFFSDGRVHPIIHFEKLIRDVPAEIKRLYSLWGISVTPEHRKCSSQTGFCRR